MQDDKITLFGKTNFRNQEVPFGIKTDDRRRHFYAIGKSGMGKTNMLENMAIQDIRNGYGMCFIDPHGDTAEKLISMIPTSRLDDVIYFNPSDRDFPISFNVLEQVPVALRPLVASGVIGVFKKLWADSWGPRLEYILRNAILALLDYPGTSLLGVMRILVDKKYRIQVINHVQDPVVKAFWVDEFSQWNDRVLQEVISPIQNKVGQFLTSPLIRNVVGQSNSAFNVREAMDQKKIIIMNLAKGSIGEDNSALMGAMMITKIQLAAMGRVDTEEHLREDFYLYVDEFQNFATESFANILSEARKYRLCLVLANQYIAQLDDIVRDAVFGNCGTIVSFRVGAADAEALEKEFEPVFTMNDIVNLPKWNIYLKLMIDGLAGDAFSAATLPPIGSLEGDSTQEVIKRTREKYAEPREVVEQKIASWSGQELPNRDAEGNVVAVAAANSPAAKGSSDSKPHSNTSDKSSQQQDRDMFDATCGDCGLNIKVPFKPDGKRPVYCKECLKERQRETAKTEQPAQPHSRTSQKKFTPQPENKGGLDHVGKRKPKPAERTEEDKVYVSDEKPLSLSQMQNVAPKKFKKNGHPKIDNAGIKDLIQNVRKN